MPKSTKFDRSATPGRRGTRARFPSSRWREPVIRGQVQVRLVLPSGWAGQGGLGGGSTSQPRSALFLRHQSSRLFTGPAHHESIDITEARNILGELPDPSKDDLDRLVRPERILTIQQIDRFPVSAVMGKRADTMLRART
jgi:hypothetical protein